MVETRVLQRTCRLCGGTLEKDSEETCPACVHALGSVVVVAADTVIAQPRVDALPRVRNFGDYEIVSELARGGMGVVFVARQISLKRAVALKMIQTSFAGAAEMRRFQAEAEHAATLEHPNIVPVYDSGTVEGLPYFTMKLIQGRSLSAELRRLVLEPRKGMALLATVARAVHYAHLRGILHRDLKPQNILIDTAGVPYVGDFGIAKRVESPGSDKTQTGIVMGTPHYMSPEQARGDSSKVTTASDIYSLGTILYEMLTLRLPFNAPTSWELLQKIKSDEPVPPRTLRRTVNRDLETICLKCLEKDPARRYASAAELADDLERWLRNEPIRARPHTVWERASKWARRRPAVAISTGLAASLVLTLAGFYWRGSELVRQADQRHLDERRRAAAAAIEDGAQALKTAFDALSANRNADNERALIDAENSFRIALVNSPDDTQAEVGLRETARQSFAAALRARNWRQAREKLLLARSAHLSQAEFDDKQAALTRLESARGEHIRARVKALMDDAAGLVRTVTHERATNELIALKDEQTVEALKLNVGNEHPECRRLACDVLAWIGDASVLGALETQINGKTPAGPENPQSVQVAALKAICMLAPDDDTNAFNQVLRRIAADPSGRDGVLYSLIKEPFKAFALRQAQVVKPRPDDPPAKLLEHAERAEEIGAWPEALALYERLVAAVPENIEHLNHRGLARYALHDLAGARADFDAVIARMPQHKMGYINRANVRGDQGDGVGALGDLDMALKLAPDDTGLWGLRGLVKQRLGDLKGAMADYDKAVELNPGDIYSLTNRGGARAMLKDYVGSMADFDRVLTQSPNFQKALTSRACARMELHDVDGALADFDKSLALNPDQPNCYYNRGALKGLKKDDAGAIREYDKYLEFNPKHGMAFYNRGVSKERIGDTAGAMSDYRKAIEFVPTRAEPLVNLAVLTDRTGDADAAMRLFDRAVVVNPRQFEAWNCRAGLHSRLGHAEQAVSDMRHALDVFPPNRPKAYRDEAEKQLKEYEEAVKK